MKKNRVVCIGEALIDRIRNKSNNGFTDFLGGAPANVACALGKLKINSEITTNERLVITEERRIEKMGYEITKENMSKHSFKYDGLITKIAELKGEIIELKDKLSEHNSPSSSKFT